jgi:hypothetical protein
VYRILARTAVHSVPARIELRGTARRTAEILPGQVERWLRRLGRGDKGAWFAGEAYGDA